MATQTVDVGSFIGDYVKFCHALIEDREPYTGIVDLNKQARAMEKLYGRANTDRIQARARAALREIFGGEPAPPVAKNGVDPWEVLDADILAERLVAEFRQQGLGRTSYPEWRPKLNRKIEELITREEKRIEQRQRDLEAQNRAKLEAQRAAHEAAQRKAEEATQRAAAVAEVQHVTVPATVAPVQVRGTEPELPAMRYAGVWKADRMYNPGECVTREGLLWHCGIPTKDKPGDSQDWQLMHKGVTSLTNKKAERTLR